jgi:hypothetical protein
MCLEEHLCSERFLLPGGTFMFRKVPFAWRNIYVPKGSFSELCLEEHLCSERFLFRALPWPAGPLIITALKI